MLRMAAFELLGTEGAIAKLRAENDQLRANNAWLAGRLRDAVNVCYGGVTHEEVDAHEGGATMSDEKKTSEPQLRMDAYYYCFEPTGVPEIDRILSAVACAGKAYHHTENWCEPTEPSGDFMRGDCPTEWIQNAARDAAEAWKKR